MKAFLAMAFGGPVKYTGKDLQSAHNALVTRGLQENHLVTLVQLFEECLQELKVPEELTKEVMAWVATTKDEVLKNNLTEDMKTIQTKNYYQEKGNGSKGGSPQPGAALDAATVAELKNRIHELERDQKRNQETLEQAVDAVVTIDASKKVLFYNKAAENMFGYKREEVIGQNVKMIVPTEHQRVHDNYVDTNIKTGVNKVVGAGRDLEMVRKDGSKFWGNLSLSKVVVGDEVQFTAFIKDISEERYLRELNTQTLEQAVDSVVTIDDAKRITFFNKAAERMFGVTREEVIGQNVKIIVPMEHRSQHDGYVDANMKTGVNRVVGAGRDLEMTRKDGSKFWGNLSLSKVDIDGKIQYTAFIKDITVTKHNEFGFQEVIKAIREIVVGSFEFDINLSGLKVDESVRQVSDDLLGLRDNVKRILDDVNEVVKQAGINGNLDARLKLTDTQGAWRDLVTSINELLQSIAEPVLEFNKIIKEMSNGDLTRRFEMMSNGDIKSIADSLNRAIDNLNDLLNNIGRNADVVASSSMNMLQKTEGMKRNTTEVASAISQMAKGAQDQAQRTDESSKLVEKVMSSAAEMESKANSINKAAERGQKSSENGLKIMKTLVSNMTGIKDSAQQTSTSIEILTKRAEEIGRTLNVITDIASQTNLLALNAAIEAARAGDAGRGFAVVAEEIRKLAEDSRKSAVEIEKIIGDVQKDTQSASKAIDMMQVSVKDGNTATDQAELIFQEIATSSEETFSFSQEIQHATAGQRSSIDSVVKNIEQIVVVAEETAAGTQQVASSSQQLNNSMSEITEGSNKLSGVAADLQAGINKFKLKRAS